MSADVMTTKSVDRSFLLSRLGSLLAIMPLGVWTLGHLWNNLSVYESGEAWQKNVTEYRHPISFFLTLLVALLPLALHTIWGIGRLFTMKPSTRQKTLVNLKYILQRLSAVGVLLFLGAHLWKALLEPRMLEHHPEDFHDMAYSMAHHMPTLVVYVLGTLGVAYHLANGVHTFCMGWGVVNSQAALKKMQTLIYVLFLGMLAASWAIIYKLWEVGQPFTQ